ncbi:synaptopodin 2-like protein [Synchiropus splendidus]|uniref:synaptopodin 2-like protein n=1 Tax=Synchiropus splendidus TaxID=270530 RepID=UPI00237E76D5|nr:synaptopodin 2-like protein [Synchiropus splendidus]
MVAEEAVITLSGGAPWGFRLQGGVEHQKPLQVAKVRKRSKACRAGLREADEIVAINEESCESLSHAQAMNLIDSSPGVLHIRVKRVPAGFQSVVLVSRAPSPRIDKEYRAALRALSPTHYNHAPVREVHRSRSSLTSGLTSPPGSEAYYGETDSDADVAGYERQRRQKRRSPSNSNPGKPTGRASPEGGETSEMSGYDSAPDARVYHSLLETGAGNGGVGLPGVARREVVYQPHGPGMWSSQTSTETSSIISSADDQGPRDVAQEEDSGFLEPANVPLVSPERAKEALMLSSRSQLVPMVGPLSKPIDEELTTTYMEKAKQAKLNRGDTQQDKHVKEAKSKCKTIASLLTDAPNPHSKGVLMFKKRRQRSKKYTLTSFGSVDEDRCLDSQEEDGVFPGSESEFDEDGFSSVPDPTWDSEYMDMLEKRATAGTEGRGDGAEDAPSPGLSDISGKGAKLFEQQRKRAAEHAKKVEASQPPTSPQSHLVDQNQMYEVKPQMQSSFQPQPAPGTIEQSPNLGASSVGNVPMAPPPVAPKPSTAPVTVISGLTSPSETPLPELPTSNVLNRTARPFTPGFISIRASTAPVTFRPPVTKAAQRPASAAVVQPAFHTPQEQASHSANIFYPQAPSHVPAQHSMPSVPFAPSPEAPVTLHAPAISTSVDTVRIAQPLTTSYPAQFATVPQFSSPSSPRVVQQPMARSPVQSVPQSPSSVHFGSSVPPPAQVSVSQQPPPQISVSPVRPVTVVNQQEEVAPTPVPGPTGRTGILLEARKRGGKPKPMFSMPEMKKNSPNPDLLSMVQNLDERFSRYKYGQPPSDAAYDGAEDDGSGEVGAGRFPPPVAPKPRVIHETPQILQAGGKGAQLFARRQNRMGMYVVDTPPETPYQQEVTSYSSSQLDPSSCPSYSSQWKYSPNVRAPPPIGYNPLLAPSIPTGPQRSTGQPESRGRGGPHRDGIKAIDFMRRQPYQLNSAMFNYGGSAANLAPTANYSAQGHQQGDYGRMVGSSLTTPKQIPVKTARTYEIKRFSTPTPMSAPTLSPKVIAPRSATTLGERINHSESNSPPADLFSPRSSTASTTIPVNPPSISSPPATTSGLPSLPKFSTAPVHNPLMPAGPTPYTPISYNSGLQSAKQFQSAPELSILASLPPLKTHSIQAPKPRFVATKGGVQPRVWRPGAM